MPGWKWNQLDLLRDGMWVREAVRSKDDSRALLMALVLVFCLFACLFCLHGYKDGVTTSWNEEVFRRKNRWPNALVPCYSISLIQSIKCIACRFHGLLYVRCQRWREKYMLSVPSKNSQARRRQAWKTTFQIIYFPLKRRKCVTTEVNLSPHRHD